MTDFNYQPPEARVDDQPEVRAQYFYVVSQRKFLVLYLITLGLYAIYWFYAHWSQQKRMRKLRIMPVWRGIFSLFFAHSLFGQIERRLREERCGHSWNASGMATLYVVLYVANGLTGFFEFSSPLYDIAGLMLIPALGIPLRAAQIAANHADHDPSGSSNNDFSGANIVWIVLGGLFCLMVLLGTYMIVVEKMA